jgi:hypothetical protein
VRTENTQSLTFVSSASFGAGIDLVATGLGTSVATGIFDGVGSLVSSVKRYSRILLVFKHQTILQTFVWSRGRKISFLSERK